MTRQNNHSLALSVGYLSLFSVALGVLMLTLPLYMMQLFDKVITTGNLSTLLWLSAIAAIALVCQVSIDHHRKALLCKLSDIWPNMATGEENYPFLRSMIRHSGAPLLDLLWMPFILATIFLLLPAAGWLTISGMVFATICFTLIWARYKPNPASPTTASLSSPTLMGALRLARLWVQLSLLALAAWEVATGNLTAGAMIAVSLLGIRCLLPVEQLTQQIHLLKPAMVDLKAYQKEANKPEEANQTIKLPKHLKRASLHLTGLHVRSVFDSCPLLVGTDTVFKNGQLVCVTGSSGTGKTLLSNLLTHPAQIQQGSIHLQGVALAHWLEQMPNQDQSFLFHYNPFELQQTNLTFSEDEKSQILQSAQLINIADQFGLTPYLSTLTELSKAPSKLPHSMQNCLYLLKIAVLDPWILVLDAADHGLDAKQREGLVQLLERRRNKACITFYTSQQTPLLKLADQLILLQKGRPARIGSPKALLSPQKPAPTSAPQPQAIQASVSFQVPSEAPQPQAKLKHISPAVSDNLSGLRLTKRKPQE